MACPYYREPAADRLLGHCGDKPGEIPSEVHQNCLCQSCSELYINFCPIYSRLEQKKFHTHKRITLRQVFSLIGHRKQTHNDGLGI